MRKVNLLPWRDWQRQRAIRQLQGLLCVSLLLGGVGVLLADLYLRHATQREQQASATLQADFRLFEQRLAQLGTLDARRRQLIAQLDAIEALRAHRLPLEHWLQQLGGQLPAGIQLGVLQVQGERWSLSGLAESGPQVARLLEHLAQVPGLVAPTLQEITALAAGEQFQLSAQVTP